MGDVQRRLNLIILAHLWALAPFAILWFIIPTWRTGEASLREVSVLAILTGLLASYLAVRTWLTWVGRAPQLNRIWPYVDVAFVTVALALVHSPTDALAILYLIPLASAVASLSLVQLVGLAAFTLAGYLLVVALSGGPWTIGVFFRLIILAVLASLYGWLIRTVTLYERAVERARFQTDLAREMHDGIQHLLVTMGARLELARRLVRETPERASAMIGEEQETARRAADELRYLVRRLRSTAEHADLATALRSQIAGTADRWPFALDVEVPSRLPRLDPSAEHAMLRVIQESLTNIAKHAQATEAVVQVSSDRDAVQCTIRDDGVGFDSAVTPLSGLHGLAERVRAAGGTLEIRSNAGQGTTITARFPILEAQRWTRSAS